VTVPLDPTADHARRLLQQELAKQEYQAAKPTLFDRIAQHFFDWLGSIRFGQVHGTSAIALTVVIVLVVASAVVLFRIYGVPRLQRRSAEPLPMFGDDDVRSASDLRRSADDAAASGDLARAIVERFRAVARDLDERGALSTSPGTTAHAFGERAAELFPGHASGLRLAARDFDGVRYLDRPGTAEAYGRVRALDTALEAAEPIRHDGVVDGATA
jgi:hypothetical protein